MFGLEYQMTENVCTYPFGNIWQVIEHIAGMYLSSIKPDDRKQATPTIIDEHYRTFVCLQFVVCIMVALYNFII